ncbi:type II toxin-antitoxin system HicA family toxin [Tissierella sp. Yu-01]|uniref:type II toxin-antitoxin system HicA family toxin n=1 Tax=Tissierella sp. Yu-01 TaxID=3035694 RepID=UPI00240D4F58|nr:type II toxin-antitoxin system HicA family toxin [Tissierella sp. Yu-01]WFA08037.1 type II toxin-antitoxin system HicA family toxin [Tissierella sp. Yu-01]
MALIAGVSFTSILLSNQVVEAGSKLFYTIIDAIEGKRTVQVPNHGKKHEIPIGILREIWKQAGWI